MKEEKERAETALATVRVEMQLAREIQKKLYPEEPPAVDGLDIGAVSYPAASAGGDYFDYICMPNGCIGIAVGDVAGHRLAAALLMASMRAHLRALAEVSADVGDLLSRMNRLLLAETAESTFCTLTFVRLDPRTRSMVYANAGHHPGYLLDNQGSIKMVLESTALPLGVMPDADFPAAPEIILQPGELLFFYTDGVSEAMSPSDVVFGRERAVETVTDSFSNRARDIAHAVYETVCKFCNPRPPQDDITSVIVKVNPAQ
jgi:sigma-B regulation protein RsbU (phosphoserine phosphatase)